MAVAAGCLIGYQVGANDPVKVSLVTLHRDQRHLQCSFPLTCLSGETIEIVLCNRAGKTCGVDLDRHNYCVGDLCVRDRCWSQVRTT